MDLPLIISLVGFLASGLISSGVLIGHQRVTTFVAFALTMGGGHLLMATLLARELFTQVPSSLVYLGFATVSLLIWITHMSSFKNPLRICEPRRELGPLAIFAVCAASILVISSHNGWQGAAKWVGHGFYNGDSATLASLVEAARNTNTLVKDNPFAVGEILEYPTLIHAAIATVSDGLAISDWTRYWPELTLLVALATIPLFFLLIDITIPEPPTTWQKWLGFATSRQRAVFESLLVLFAMTLSWDTYIYPQGHFFVTALFLALAVLAVALTRQANRTISVSLVLLAAVVIPTNAVTGLAAGVVAMACGLKLATTKSIAKHWRVTSFAAAVLAPLYAFVMLPGMGGVSLIPHASYTAVPSLLPYLLPIIGIAWAVLWYPRHSFFGLTAAGLMLLAGIVLIFSSRDLLAANSSRFLYHAILVAFPLLLHPFAHVVSYFKRDVLHTSYAPYERLSIGLLAVAVMAVILSPNLASFTSAHHNLLAKDEIVLGPQQLTPLKWLNDNTSPTDVIIVNPDLPLVVPQFAGRGQVRTNYWLSPRSDLLYRNMDAAFQGNRAAQERVLSLGDYLFLTPADPSAWPIQSKPVFKNDVVTIYDLNGN